MHRSTILFVFLGTTIFFLIKGSNAEVKKSLRDVDENSSPESEDQYDLEKKKRSASDERGELLREFVDRLSQRYKQSNQLNYKHEPGSDLDLDENVSSRFGPNNDDFDSHYESEEDDYKRRKKSLIKKKRFREYFRKRNAFQNRYKKFRENF
ncbi:hypothetical protein BpHYR1_048499 [Brachionus plicatilis]|uniref:Uncharacterized protein n=1 Tax=Brachionus plicatilis TaxID=10195 RepID=A0A3M7SCY8_BRAPC|nr:hypothetical protein BpHYR1_048499 [Brachionus plicatilis]